IRAYRQDEVRDHPIRLQYAIVKKRIAVVAPYRGGAARMVPGVHPREKQPRVNETMTPIEPGIKNKERADQRDGFDEKAPRRGETISPSLEGNARGEEGGNRGQ